KSTDCGACRSATGPPICAFWDKPLQLRPGDDDVVLPGTASTQRFIEMKRVMTADNDFSVDAGSTEMQQRGPAAIELQIRARSVDHAGEIAVAWKVEALVAGQAEVDKVRGPSVLVDAYPAQGRRSAHHIQL